MWPSKGALSTPAFSAVEGREEGDAAALSGGTAGR